MPSAAPRLQYDTFETPLGPILLVATARGVCALNYEDCRERTTRLLHRRFGSFELVPMRDPHGASRAVRRYLAGDLTALEAIPLDLGGTVFQRAVWAELRRVCSGATASYSEIAGRIGRPAAVRAVGMANHCNPVALAVPCHRIVGADGSLTGYAGGLQRKRWLLAHEGNAAARVSHLR